MAYGSSSSSSDTTVTTNSATDYSGSGYTETTSSNNAQLGYEKAKNIRDSLGESDTYFDQKLLGEIATVSFSFNPQIYDIVYGQLESSGTSSISSQILAYEIMALSKLYDTEYDKILPLIKNSSITITKNQLTRLNQTRPNTNALNIINSDISKDILKERVD